MNHTSQLSSFRKSAFLLFGYVTRDSKREKKRSLLSHLNRSFYPGSESPKGGRQKRQRVENEKEGKIGEGRRRLWSNLPAIVAVSQSGASGQDFVRDSIGGKFYLIDSATVCQLRCAKKSLLCSSRK